MKYPITFQPSDLRVDAAHGGTVLDAAQRARVAIRTRCGGKAGCLMCKVKQLSPGGLSTPGPEEVRKLGALLDEGYRLACQARLVGPASVEVPEDPLRAAVRRQLARQQDEDSLW